MKGHQRGDLSVGSLLFHSLPGFSQRPPSSSLWGTTQARFGQEVTWTSLKRQRRYDCAQLGFLPKSSSKSPPSAFALSGTTSHLSQRNAICGIPSCNMESLWWTTSQLSQCTRDSKLDKCTEMAQKCHPSITDGSEDTTRRQGDISRSSQPEGASSTNADITSDQYVDLFCLAVWPWSVSL